MAPSTVRHSLPFLFLLAWRAGAETPPPACVTLVSPPALVRAEGVAEKVGDIVVTCPAGALTATGFADVTVTLAGGVSSRVVAPGSASEALLLIDDPASPVVGTNLVQGVASGAAVVFPNVPMTPPGGSGPITFRITNLRANAAAVSDTGQIQATVAISNAIAISNPAVTVGLKAPGAFFALEDPAGGPLATMWIPAGAGAALTHRLRFSEGFAQSFRKRNLATSVADPMALADQIAPRRDYQTDSAFYSDLLPGRNGLNQAGLATQGTRLVARFRNIPAGAALYVTTRALPGTGDSAVLTVADAAGAGPFSAIAPTQTIAVNGAQVGIAQVTLTNGGGTAAWEILDADPDRLESYVFGVVVVSSQSAIAEVVGGLGPFSTSDATDGAVPVPRFADPALSGAIDMANGSQRPLPSFRAVAAPPMNCRSYVAAPTQVRGDGMTEILGDLVLRCSGGTPTPAGVAVPTTDVIVTFPDGKPPTSRTYANGWSEALLMVDEPGQPRLGTGAALACSDSGGSCSITGTGNGVGVYTGAAGRPNVFAGKIDGNVVRFAGVPVDSPGLGTRILRIVNLRVDGTRYTNGAPVTVSVVGSTIHVLNPQQTAGFVVPAMDFALRLPDNSGSSKGVTVSACATGAQRAGVLRFSEAFQSAFMTRTAAPLVNADRSALPEPQNVPGTQYHTESGFYAPALSSLISDFTTMGLADFGTRLRARIDNIPNGARVFVSTQPVAFTDGTPAASVNGLVARLIAQESAFSPMGPTAMLEGVPAAELTVRNGSASAVWEVLRSDPNTAENADFLIWVQPGETAGAATVSAPRFAAGTAVYRLFSVSACSLSFTTPAALPDGTAGASYSRTLHASGGTPPYTFSLASGALPDGLTLLPDGNLSGVSQPAGDFSFTLTAADARGIQSSRAFALHVAAVSNAGIASAVPSLFGFQSGNSRRVEWSTNNADVDGGPSSNALTGHTARIAQTPQALRFVPVTPCRIADTRGANGPFGGPILAGQTTRNFVIPNSTCGIPAGAQAYSLNIAVVPPGPLGYLTVWPAGLTQPNTSVLNSLDGRVKSNAAIIPAGTGGAISIFPSNPTHVVLDINGYFVSDTDPTALAFYPITPCRIADTRNANGPLGGPSMPGQQARTFPILSSTCGIPATARAYSLNLAVVPQGPLGYLTAWPTGQPLPNASSVNALTGAVTANAAIVPAGTNGSIDIFPSNTTHLVIDVNGYFAPAAAGGLALFNLTPCRVLDTRANAAPPFSGAINVDVAASGCGAPSTAAAVVFGATVAPPGPLGYLTLWPQGQTQPLVATLNAVDGFVTSNLAIVPASNGKISAFASNSTQLVLDLFGYFAPNTLAITTDPTLPDAATGQLYSAQINAVGGTLPYSWSASNLPAWLTLGGACGAATICGTPASADAGQVSFTITVTDSASPTHQSVGQLFNLNVTYSGPKTIAVPNVSVGANLQTPVTITLSPPTTAPVQLTITSGDATAILLGNSVESGKSPVIVSLPANSTSVQLFVKAIAASGSVTLTATASGYTDGTGTATITKSGFVLSGPNGIGNGFTTYQGVGAGVIVYPYRLNSSNVPIENQPLRGGLSVSVPIVVSPASLGTMGSPTVAFAGGDPSAAAVFTASFTNTGSGSLTATPPAGFVAPSTGSVLSVTVLTSGFIPPTGVTVGRNLQIPLNLSLSGAAGSDTPVTIQSSDPTLVKFATSPTGAGSQSITVTIPRGGTHTPDFYVRGYGSSGSVPYTISSASYGSVTPSMLLGPSGFVIVTPAGQGTDFNVTLGGPDPTLAVASALYNGSGAAVEIQSVAADVTVTATLASSTPSVGTVSATSVAIAGGTTTGSASFHAVSIGSTNIVASASGYSSSSVKATVVNVSLFLNPVGSVGKFLAAPGLVNLNTPAAADTVITLTSNSSLLKLAVNTTDAGSNSITVTVNAGHTNAAFWVFGLDSSGTASYTAAASNSAPVSDTVTLAPSAVVVYMGAPGNPSCFGVVAPYACTVSRTGGPQPVYAVTYQLSTDGTNTIAGSQALAGSASLSVSLSNNNPGAGTVPASISIAGGTKSTSFTFTPSAVGVAVITANNPSGWTAAAYANGSDITKLGITVN